MGLLDSLLSAYQSGMGLLAPNQKDVEMRPQIAKGLLGVLPGSGDAISGYDAMQSAREGNYGEAALNGVGLLPFIPSMGGMIKADRLNDVLSTINQKHGVDIGAHLWPMMGDSKGVYVGRVVVPAENRGAGVGTAAMKDLLDVLDAEQTKSFLSAELGLGATSKERLYNFYKNLGYRENKGRKKDFEAIGNFIRDPQ